VPDLQRLRWLNWSGRPGVLRPWIAAEMLAMARKRTVRAGVQTWVEFRQCRPDALGLDGRFDFINAFYMVHEVPDTRRFLMQVRQVLRPGGRLFIAEPRLHVSGRAYSRMRNTAREVGLLETGRPPVRFSRASVFELP
jgi:ubiquinone/menaquinone biosynthesis C-methylase UbiE